MVIIKVKFEAAYPIVLLIKVAGHFGIETFGYKTSLVPVSRDTSVLMPKWSRHFGPSTERSGDTSALIVSK